jgi:predicted small metal-binding protein
MRKNERTTVILIDGVKYRLMSYKNEEELEEIVKEHTKEIFGVGSIYFDIKSRMISGNEIMSEPDGYLIDFLNDTFWIVEIELSTHDLYGHIVEQLTRFINNIEDAENQKMVTDKLHSYIKSDMLVESQIKKAIGSKDLHDYISQLLSDYSKNPNVIIVIDKAREIVEKACKTLKIEPYIVELKTFVRVGCGIGTHIHLFDIPSEWEEDVLPCHAIYDKSRKVFLCNCGGEAHKKIATYNVGEIVEHLLMAHGIPPDEQIIEGWTDSFEKQAKKYVIKKYHLKSKS